MISVEKPGSPEEILVHFGRKGMKWGVRNNSRLNGSVSKPKMSTKKKVAIGIGVTAGVAAVAGAAFVAYKMRSGGKLPILQVGKAATGRSGQRYVSNLSHAQWNNKIKASQSAFETISRQERMRAYNNTMRSLKKNADFNVDWVAIAKKNNPGVFK